MAVNKLKDEIKDILKASARKSRRELSKGKFETYVFKKHFINEWCQYCLDTVGVNDLKLKKSNFSKIICKPNKVKLSKIILKDYLRSASKVIKRQNAFYRNILYVLW